MINLNEEQARRELVARYLNAETTLEEEHLLAEFLSEAGAPLSSDEEDVLLLLQSTSLVGRADTTTDKAEEFDRLMKEGRRGRGRCVAMRWALSVAAAVVCAFLLFPAIHTEGTKEQRHSPLPFSLQRGGEESRAGKPSSLAKGTEEGAWAGISTSELLETVRLLSGIGTDDVVITASSCDEGFIVKTTDSNGPSKSYMLRRCPDGTSIELISQFINF